MKLKIVAAAALFAASVVLAACGNDGTNDVGSTEGSSSTEKETVNIKELVSDYSGVKLKDQSASITSKQLIVTDKDENKTVYKLPDDEFFVSIAPYINETHPCTDHSLTGCQGELAEEEFEVYIEDMDGNIILDETVKSLSNGFFDLWLPRDKTYHIKITHDGKMAESEFSTFENDGTCITTIQLK